VQSWLLILFALALVSFSMKVAGREATRMKHKMASLEMVDPVINALAWFDRITTFHRS
jgi:hypothetical protein